MDLEPTRSPVPAGPDGSPDIADDGTDLTLIRWALSLTPLERLQVFEAWMAEVVVMLGAADPP